MRTVSHRDDLDALLTGLGIMGTGGGGNPKGSGLRLFNADHTAGRSYALVSVDEVPDDAFIASGGYLGSVAATPGNGRKELSEMGPSPLEIAIRALEREHEKTVDYLIPFELGGGNTPAVMSCAAGIGIPVIDGDGIGRAAPETHMSSFLGHGISLTPMPLAGSDGSLVVVKRGDLFLADEMGRCIASREKGRLANAHYGMTGIQLKKAAVRGSISQAMALGQYVRTLRCVGEDALDAVCEFLGGVPLLFGEVCSADGESIGGFYEAHVVLRGIGRFAGARLALVIKNEVMCAKVDGQAQVMFPDLVLLLDPDSLDGIMTPELSMGRRALVLGVPCVGVVREAAMTDLGVRAFSPSRYGEALEYVPMETLLTR